jgi:hypothetical protein
VVVASYRGPAMASEVRLPALVVLSGAADLTHFILQKALCKRAPYLKTAVRG